LYWHTSQAAGRKGARVRRELTEAAASLRGFPVLPPPSAQRAGWGWSPRPDPGPDRIGLPEGDGLGMPQPARNAGGAGLPAFRGSLGDLRGWTFPVLRSIMGPRDNQDVVI